VLEVADAQPRGGIVAEELHGVVQVAEARLTADVDRLETAYRVIDPRNQGVEGSQREEREDDPPLPPLVLSGVEEQPHDEEGEGGGDDAAARGGEDQAHAHHHARKEDQKPPQMLAGEDSKDAILQAFASVRSFPGTHVAPAGKCAGVADGKRDAHLHEACEVVAVEVGALDGFIRSGLQPQHVMVAGEGLGDAVERLEATGDEENHDERLDAVAGLQRLQKPQEEEAVDDPADQRELHGMDIGGDREPGPRLGESGGLGGGQRVSSHRGGFRRDPQKQSLRKGRHLEDEKDREEPDQGIEVGLRRAEDPVAVFPDDAGAQDQEARRQHAEEDERIGPHVREAEEKRAQYEAGQINAEGGLFHFISWSLPLPICHPPRFSTVVPAPAFARAGCGGDPALYSARKSQKKHSLWIPAFAGMTRKRTGMTN